MTIKIEPLDKAGYRKFGLIMATIIALLFGLFFPWALTFTIPIWPWGLATVLAGLALLLPNTLSFIYTPWMIFGHYIGLFNTKLILIIVFFIIFFPISLLLKVLGKDAMDRQFNKKSAPSCWKESKKQDKSHMEKLY